MLSAKESLGILQYMWLGYHNSWSNILVSLIIQCWIYGHDEMCNLGLYSSEKVNNYFNLQLGRYFLFMWIFYLESCKKSCLLFLHVNMLNPLLCWSAEGYLNCFAVCNMIASPRSLVFLPNLKASISNLKACVWFSCLINHCQLCCQQYQDS